MRRNETMVQIVEGFTRKIWCESLFGDVLLQICGPGCRVNVNVKQFELQYLDRAKQQKNSGVNAPTLEFIGSE